MVLDVCRGVIDPLLVVCNDGGRWREIEGNDASTVDLQRSLYATVG